MSWGSGTRTGEFTVGLVCMPSSEPEGNQRPGSARGTEKVTVPFLTDRSGSLDGSKFKANNLKHKAMSHGRPKLREHELGGRGGTRKGGQLRSRSSPFLEYNIDNRRLTNFDAHELRGNFRPITFDGDPIVPWRKVVQSE